MASSDPIRNPLNADLPLSKAADWSLLGPL
jgi:hypothetical protein